MTSATIRRSAAFCSMVRAMDNNGATDIFVAQVPLGGLLTAGVNRASFAAGDMLALSVAVDNAGMAAVVDLYLGIILPDGDSTVFLTNGGQNLVMGRLSSLATFRATASGVSLAAPLSVSAFDFLTYRWTGSEPRGTYVVFLATLAGGAVADGVVTPAEVLASSMVSFTFP